MTTIFDRTATEEASAQPIALPRRHEPHNGWVRSCATGGAGLWAALAVLARAGMLRLGGIELLFLFAPLVVVPLGMALGRGLEFLSPGRTVRENSSARAIDWFIGRMQPVAAVSAVIALLVPPGRAAGLWACPWLFLGLLLAVSAMAGSISAMASRRVPLVWEWALLIAKIDLLVGGAWFLISRLGIRPMRFVEPIGLLTAVHFHFAGFATAMIAAAAGQFAALRSARRWLRWLIAVVVGMPFVVAVGFVTLPALKMGAALLFGISVAGLALCLRSLAKTMSHRTSRVLLEVAPASVFAAMVLAGAYAIADFVGSDRLTIPQMARTHGVLNGVGFCLPGLLAWLVEMESAPECRQ
jgi:YndJ-like protein